MGERRRKNGRGRRIGGRGLENEGRREEVNGKVWKRRLAENRGGGGGVNKRIG